MPVTLTPEWIASANKLQGSDAWAWCWGFELDISESGRYLLPIVNRDEPITLTGFQDPLTPNVEAADREHYPMPFTQSPFSENSDGDLPTVSIGLSNQLRTMSTYFEQGNGFVGNRAYGALVNTRYPGTTQVRTFTVVSAVVTIDVVQVQLEMPNALQVDYPEDRYDARLCGVQFGSAECGYPVNAAAAYTTCGLHVADCNLRGDDEVARNLPRLHPRRFDAFPGVPNQ